MSDARLRLLSRWASTGGPVAQSSLLRARIRSGVLREDFVRVMAHAGHRASLLVFPDETPLPLANSDDVRKLWQSIELLGTESFTHPCPQLPHGYPPRMNMEGTWAYPCCDYNTRTVEVSWSQKLWVSFVCTAVEESLTYWPGCGGPRQPRGGRPHPDDCRDCGAPRRALDDGRRWLAAPSEENRWRGSYVPGVVHFWSQIHLALQYGSSLTAIRSMWSPGRLNCPHYLKDARLRDVLLNDLERNLLCG